MMRAQCFVVEVEAERFDQMKFGAGIGAEADDVAGVGRYFWLEKDDGDHGCSYLMFVGACEYGDIYI